MRIYFDHEKLDAYRKALAFAAWSETLLPEEAVEYRVGSEE